MGKRTITPITMSIYTSKCYGQFTSTDKKILCSHDWRIRRFASSLFLQVVKGSVGIEPLLVKPGEGEVKRKCLVGCNYYVHA